MKSMMHSVCHSRQVARGGWETCICLPGRRPSSACGERRSWFRLPHARVCRCDRVARLELLGRPACFAPHCVLSREKQGPSKPLCVSLLPAWLLILRLQRARSLRAHSGPRWQSRKKAAPSEPVLHSPAGVLVEEKEVGKKKMTAVGKSKRQAGTTRSPFKRRLPPGYSSIVAGAARPGRSMFPREASAALFLPLHGLAAAARRRPVCCPPLLLPSGTHVNGTRRRL